MMSLSDIGSSASHEWGWMRRALTVLMYAFVGLMGAPKLEAYLRPVLKNITYSDARLEGTRLCFVMHWTKQREATGIFYAAQVYEGENPHPWLVSLEHVDETPFGGDKSGAPPGTYDTDACVEVRPIAARMRRIGVRIYIRYQPPYWPWTLDQEPIWIDYYRQG